MKLIETAGVLEYILQISENTFLYDFIPESVVLVTLVKTRVNNEISQSNQLKQLKVSVRNIFLIYLIYYFLTLTQNIQKHFLYWIILVSGLALHTLFQLKL